MDDNEKYFATLIPNEQMKCSGLIERVIKRMTDEIALGIINLVSDGKEYAIKMLPEQRKEIPNSLGYWSTEIREGISVKELVRCKDCVHHRYEELGMVWCPNIVGSWVMEDFYCADGERKEGSV